METNTVIISVERYEELRAHENVLKDKENRLLIWYVGGGYFEVRTIDQSVKELVNKANHLTDHIEERDKEIRELKEKIKDIEERPVLQQLKTKKHGWFRSK
jgi:prefoldin subunit 5